MSRFVATALMAALIGAGLGSIGASAQLGIDKMAALDLNSDVFWNGIYHVIPFRVCVVLSGPVGSVMAVFRNRELASAYRPPIVTDSAIPPVVVCHVVQGGEEWLDMQRTLPRSVRWIGAFR